MEQERLKLGVLFSQSGPMAVTETAHLQGVMLACEEINAANNEVLIDPIILDPQGDDRRYAELATELLLKHRVNCILGCCLSSSRKAVLPVIERFNGILFYPSVYEGFEYSPNVIYGGATPNQMIIPLLEYIFTHHGCRVALLGSETLYARETNRIVKEFLSASGGIVVDEHYFPFGLTSREATPVLSRIRHGAPDVIISTMVGEDSVTLYSAHGALNTPNPQIPIASLTTTESELSKIDEKARKGHLAVSSYFGSLDSEASSRFMERFQQRFGETTLPGVYSEVTYSLTHLVANAAKLAGSFDSDEILTALSGTNFQAPRGSLAVDIDTHHFPLRPLIGLSNQRGGYDIVWESPVTQAPDPYLITYDRTVPTQQDM